MDASLIPKTEEGWEGGSAHSSSEGSSAGAPPAPRRRSTRDIKRTKFDDEIVQSFPSKSPRKATKPEAGEAGPLGVPPVIPAVPSPTLPAGLKPSPVPQHHPLVPKEEPRELTPLVLAAPPGPSLPLPPPPPVAVVPKTAPAQLSLSLPQTKANGTKRRAVRGKGGGHSACPSPNHTLALEDLGRWTPTDDLALITAVMQTNDLEKVQTGIKFSCKFTLEEVQERWYALLYDPHISKMAVEGMRDLPLDTVIRVQSNTLFKRSEEAVLAAVAAGSEPRPTLETFGALLEAHPDVFHHSRTPASLLAHWAHLSECRLLAEGVGATGAAGAWPVAGDGKELAFAELEANLAAEGDLEALDPVAEAEAAVAERALGRDLAAAEAEAGRWTVAVESVTGISPPDFDNRTMAVLRGRLVRFLVRSREVTIGRSSRDKGPPVDVDLSFEGPAMKVSRRQATIKLRSTGDFFIANDGKRPMYVDGKPLLTLAKTRLDNNAVIEVANIRLVFLLNQELMSTIRADAAKMLTA